MGIICWGGRLIRAFSGGKTALLIRVDAGSSPVRSSIRKIRLTFIRHVVYYECLTPETNANSQRPGWQALRQGSNEGVSFLGRGLAVSRQ